MKTAKKHEPKAHSKIKVLIVDDHSLVRRGLVAMLATEADIDLVGQVATGEALESIRSLRPQVVVVDITMRGAQGLAIIQQTAYDPQVKVIALDLHSEPTYATRAIKLGAKGYITENSETELAPAIRRVFAGSLAVSDGVAQQMVAALTQIAQAPANDPMGALSDRELEMAELVGKGYSTSQLADEMKISVKTVETHKAHMKKKLGIAKGSQLVRYCVSWFEQRNALRS